MDGVGILAFDQKGEVSSLSLLREFYLYKQRNLNCKYLEIGILRHRPRFNDNCLGLEKGKNVSQIDRTSRTSKKFTVADFESLVNLLIKYERFSICNSIRSERMPWFHVA